MTTTRRFTLLFALLMLVLTNSDAQTAPLSIGQPFEALTKAENDTLKKIDLHMHKNEWQLPLDSAWVVQLEGIINRLSGLPDTAKAEVAVPLAIARVFKGSDLTIYGEFPTAITLCDAAIATLRMHARDTGSIYALAMALVVKAYAFENLFYLEEALLARDQGIEVFKRIGCDAQVLTERVNKSQIYVQMGNEKAGLKELDYFDSVKSRYTLDVYFKLEIFALSMRAAFLANAATKKHQMGAFEAAKPMYEQAVSGLNKAYEILEKYKERFSGYEFTIAQYHVSTHAAMVYLNGDLPKREDNILAHIARAEALGDVRFVTNNIIKCRVWTKKKDFGQATFLAQTLLKTLIDPKIDTADIFSSPSVNVHNIPYLHLMPDAYFAKGQLLVEMYADSKARNKPDLRYLKHGFYCYQKAIAAIDTLRMNFSTDETMQNVVKKFSCMYPVTVLTVGQLYEETKNTAYLDTMLRIAEQFKTFTLRQTIYTRTNRDRYTGETRQLQIKEQGFKRELITAQNVFGANPTLESLQNLNVVHDKYSQFKENLKKMPLNTEGGRYYAERFADSVPTIRDVQRDWLATKKGETPRVFLSYTFSPTHILALLITADTARPYVRETPPQLWTLLKKFNQSIEFETSFPNAAAYALYDALLKEILQDVPPNAHLIISAEGPLLRLPFEALLTEPTDGKDYPKMPFLIRKHRVSYLPSLTTQMWLRTFHASAKPIKQKIGIVKGNYVLEQNIITPLMNAADSVARFFNKAATVFDNNKTPFMPNEKEESDLTDLFFVLHGEASAANPLDYALILRDSKDSVLTRLTVEKIQQMRFKKLNSVVFGACETQHGELDLSEGLFSIARAFQGLGCRHIVCTLNSVKVEQTALLLNNFFFHYKGEDKSLSRALHEAKIDYLSSKMIRREKKHPHYWANLIYLGDY